MNRRSFFGISFAPFLFRGSEPERAWRSLDDELPLVDGNLAVLLYGPHLDNDEFVGHPYQVSNPLYVANGNARKAGYTHWCPIEPIGSKSHLWPHGAA